MSSRQRQPQRLLSGRAVVSDGGKKVLVPPDEPLLERIRDEEGAALVDVTSLEVRGHRLRVLGGIARATTLTVLRVQANCLESLAGVETLVNLRVLDVSGNAELASLGPVVGLTELRALVASDTALGELPALALPHLNTLVVSRNANLKHLPDLSGLPELTKLSASQCPLKKLPKSLATLSRLSELRLNGCKLKELPVTLRSNARLKLLDVGNNRIASVLPELAALGALNYLRNVSVVGNPLCSGGEYAAAVQKLVPHLQILDGSRLVAKTRAKTKRRKRAKRPRPTPEEQEEVTGGAAPQVRMETSEAEMVLAEEEETKQRKKEKKKRRKPDDDDDDDDDVAVDFEEFKSEADRKMRARMLQTGVVGVEVVKKSKKKKRMKKELEAALQDEKKAPEGDARGGVGGVFGVGAWD